MQTRRFGRTNHMSTVAIFGGAALSTVSQKEADTAVEQAIAAGVNHIDIAPSYGEAEIRMAPWTRRERQRFFLGCKTTQRTRKGAAEEMQRSLKRLGVDGFDLYQFHAVNTFEELDEITGPGGALEAFLAARQAGLTRFIGITGHGALAPSIYLEALRRMDLDSVLFPINFVQYANPVYRQAAEKLLAECRARDVGTMIIKSVAQRPWGNQPQTHDTWYKPFTDAAVIQKAVDFVLSQDVTGLCTAGDVHVLPLVLQACEAFKPMSGADQEALIATASQFEPLFV